MVGAASPEQRWVQSPRSWCGRRSGRFWWCDLPRS